MSIFEYLEQIGWEVSVDNLGYHSATKDGRNRYSLSLFTKVPDKVGITGGCLTAYMSDLGKGHLAHIPIHEAIDLLSWGNINNVKHIYMGNVDLLEGRTLEEAQIYIKLLGD